MSINGDLTTFSVANLLQMLNQDGKSGKLAMRRGNIYSEIYFNKGQIIYADSNRKPKEIVSTLRSKGIIAEEEMDKMMQIARADGVDVRIMLVKKGIIPYSLLKKYLLYQVQEIVYAIFLWDNGNFQFIEGDIPKNIEGSVDIKLSVMEVILESTRRLDEWALIRDHIKSENEIYETTDSVWRKNKVIGAEEWRIISLLDGSRSIQDIITESGYSEFAVYKNLSSLKQTGLIRKKAELLFDSAGNFYDFKGIFEFYNEVIDLFRRDIEPLIGDTFYSIIESCKNNLEPQHQSILSNFTAQKGVPIDTSSIASRLGKENSFKKAKTLLTDSFNIYCETILSTLSNTVPKKVLNDLKDKLNI